MSEHRPSDLLVTDAQIDSLIAWATGRKRPNQEPLPRRVLAAALAELKRHRQLEHDHYWGKEDD
jgi:hypothetical protein